MFNRKSQGEIFEKKKKKLLKQEAERIELSDKDKKWILTDIHTRLSINDKDLKEWEKQPSNVPKDKPKIFATLSEKAAGKSTH